jgi:hypothetical protein
MGTGTGSVAGLLSNIWMNQAGDVDEATETVAVVTIQDARSARPARASR